MSYKPDQNRVLGAADVAPKARRGASSICLSVRRQTTCKIKTSTCTAGQYLYEGFLVFWSSGLLSCDRRPAVQKFSSPRAESWSAVEDDNHESRRSVSTLAHPFQRRSSTFIEYSLTFKVNIGRAELRQRGSELLSFQ
jgi:hypothetical protein